MSWRTVGRALCAGACLWLQGCAKQSFPPGGPEDRTPPEVASSEPASGSTSVPLGTPIVVTFTEAMQRDEVEKALNIFPPPTGGLSLDWQGTSLRISPDTAWEADRTYILILQAQARDRHNNRLARSLQIAFATGDRIDSGVISGRILRDGRPAAGSTALLFRAETGRADPERDTADYVVTADSSGRFEFGYLGRGAYRIFGLDDRDRDWLWNVGLEQIAVPSMDARLVQPEDSIVLPPLLLMPLDTVMPTILNCGMVAPGILQIDLSLDLDSSRLDRQGVALKRAGEELSAARLYMQDTLSGRFYAHFASPPSAGTWTMEVDLEHGGSSEHRLDSCEVIVPDSILPAALRAAPRMALDSTWAGLAWGRRVDLRLPQPAQSVNAPRIACEGLNIQVSVPCTLLSPFTMVLTVPEDAYGLGPLEFRFPAGYVQWAAGGSWPLPDSEAVITMTFPFLDSLGRFELTYGDSDFASWPELKIGMRPVTSPRGILWREPGRKAPLSGDLRAGDYLLFMLADRDGDLRRDAGWPFPFRPSEPFWELPDTLHVRARFTTELTLRPPAKKQLP